MYGIAQGRTRQWLHELAEENGVAYNNFTPPGAETTEQVRERAIRFFRKLCQELLIRFGRSSLLTKQNASRSISIENLFFNQQISKKSIKKRSTSTGNLDVQHLIFHLPHLTNNHHHHHLYYHVIAVLKNNEI
jgi:hypothetical protein